MKMLTGFILGVLLVFLLGALNAIPEYRVHIVSGSVDKPVLYQSTFSGITPTGECYLAITDTQTGKTEIVKITESNLHQHFGPNSYPKINVININSSSKFL